MGCPRFEIVMVSLPYATRPRSSDKDLLASATFTWVDFSVLFLSTPHILVKMTIFVNLRKRMKAQE